MLTMYDKSLDQLKKHSWSLNADWANILPNTNWRTRYSNNLSRYGEMTFRPLGERQLDFSSFNIPWYRAFGGVLMYKTSGKQTVKIERHSAAKKENIFDCVETVSRTGSVDGGMNGVMVRGAKLQKIIQSIVL